jgi:hypothetical protein
MARSSALRFTSAQNGLTFGLREGTGKGAGLSRAPRHRRIAAQTIGDLTSVQPVLNGMPLLENRTDVRSVSRRPPVQIRLCQEDERGSDRCVWPVRLALANSSGRHNDWRSVRSGRWTSKSQLPARRNNPNILAALPDAFHVASCSKWTGAQQHQKPKSTGAADEPSQTHRPTARRPRLAA